MKFDCIEDIKRYMTFLKGDCTEQSKWYKDLEWFCSNKYITTSEYFGELMLFIEQLIVDDEMKKHKCELVELKNVLRAYFK